MHLIIADQSDYYYAFTITVHDTDLNFSADYRGDNPQVAAQPSAYVHADT